MALVVLQLAGTMGSLLLPSLNADIIDHGIVRGDIPRIWRIGGWMLLASLGQVVASVAATYCASRIAMGVGHGLRRDVFAQVQTFSTREVQRFGAATLVTRGTNDVQQVQITTFLGLSMLVQAPIMGVGGVVMAMRQDVELSWVIGVSVLVMLVGLGSLVLRLLPRFRIVQERLDELTRVVREQIQGVRVVRAFVREDAERARFELTNQGLYDANLAAGRLIVAMFPLVMAVMSVSQVGVLWFGGQRVADGAMQVGALTAFLSYLVQILMSVMMATMVATMLPRAQVSSERLSEVLHTVSSLVPSQAQRVLPSGALEVRLDAVTLRYPGAERPVLDNVSFVVPAGTTTAVIGGTGSGKSTLLRVIPRLVDVDSGAVLLAGVDVRDVEYAALAGSVATVPQTAWLFAGTVAENLRFARPDASDDELAVALADAQAGFVHDMGGLDATVTQGGASLSGGQRQRLAIARALVAQAPVLLLDDSFSALDATTERDLRSRLRERRGQSTVIVVSQRVASVRDADQIVVLDEGRVVGVGTHADLLATCATYAEIVDSQEDAPASSGALS